MTTQHASTRGPDRPAAGGSHRAGPGSRSRLRDRWPTLVGACLVVIVAASSVWRFASFTEAGPAGRSVGAPPGVAEQIAGLEARAADADSAEVWRELGVLYIARAAEIEDPSFYVRSRDALDRAAALAPDDFEVVAARAALELAAHRFAPALELARAAHALRPGSPDGYAVLVDAEVETGHYEEALAHLEEWLAAKPDLSSLSRLSYLRELHGDPEGAILAMTQAVAAGSATPADRATAEAYLGDQHFATGDLERAERAYTASLANAPGNLIAEVGLGRVMAARGDGAAARDRLAGIASATPAPNVTELLGELNLLTGRPDAAASAFAAMRERYELFERSGADASLEQAAVAATYGDPTEAVRHADEAHRGRRSVFTADAMGWALTRAGRADEALPYVREALRLGTRSPSFHLHAAFAYEAIGDVEQARVHLRASLEANRWIYPGFWPTVDDLASRLGLPRPERS